jgi:GNAT superfamily N-acetyltransferase
LTLIFRSARPDDYPAVACIHNAQNEPDFHATPERLRAGDERSAERDMAFHRYVAELDGAVIATGDLRSTWAGEAHPGRYWTLLCVREDHRHQGVDVRMLHHAVREAPEPVREVWTCIREDFVPAAGFLDPEGFVERFRSWGAHLDLSSFDPTRFDPLVPELERDGIRLAAYHDLAGDPDRDRRLVDLQRELEEDALAFEPVIPRRHDDVTSPDTLLDATVVAVAPDGRYVGIASLVGEAAGAQLGCGFTGVALPYRNRGIATALKARVAQIATGMGCVELNTGGGGVDTPMLRVNRKLGFEIEPAWITLASRR